MTVPAFRGVLFDFHETLISADRWMAMETRGIATEILDHLGIGKGAVTTLMTQQAQDAHTRLRAISRDTGLEYPAAEVARVILRDLGLETRFDDGAIAAAVERLFRSYVGDVRLKPRVAETLTVMARHGCRLAVVSNATYGPFLEWALDACGIRGHFERIVVSADVGLRKPRREIFDAALRAMELASADAVYVGNDYLKDVVGAKLAGLSAVWIPEASATDHRRYTRVHPDARADTFDAVPEILDRLQALRTAR